MNKLRLTGLLLTRLLGLLLVYVSCVQVGYAQQSGGGNYPTGNGVRVKEVDGSPNVPGTQTLVFPNGSLTRAGQTVTVTIAGGTTINSTDGQVPYRVNSTTFGDSAFASNALNSTYLSATSAASGSGLTLAVAGGGAAENLFLNPKGTGTVRIAAGAAGLAIGAAIRDGFAPTLHIEGALPGLSFYENDAASNAKQWEFFPFGGQFVARTMNDAISGGENWMEVNRSGSTVTSVVFPKAFTRARQVSIGADAPTSDVRWGLYINNPDASSNNVHSLLQVKTGGDSTDLNIDGAVFVKHGKSYIDTAGYNHALQVYAEAGMRGIIIGNNNYVGCCTEPYAPGPAEVGNGFVRFELGPIWPRSEVGRFNNQGDFLVGWTEIGSYTASQSGTTVTSTVGSFSSTDVGKFYRWEGGTGSVVDKITAYTDSTHVTVETSRTMASQNGRVITPKAAILKEGYVLGADGAAATPGLAFVGASNWGFYRDGSYGVGLTIAGTQGVGFDNSSVYVRNTGGFYWGSGAPFSTPDLRLERDAANNLGQRNGANAQKLSVYNTYTSGSNYERLGIQASSNAFFITPEAATGTVRELVVGAAGSATRLRTSLAVPSAPSLADGDWWVECTGTSPSRVCATKVYDGGATRTIASVTY